MTERSVYYVDNLVDRHSILTDFALSFSRHSCSTFCRRRRSRLVERTMKKYGGYWTARLFVVIIIVLIFTTKTESICSGAYHATIRAFVKFLRVDNVMRCITK